MNKTWIVVIAIIVIAIIGWYLLSGTTESKEVTTNRIKRGNNINRTNNHRIK